MGGDRARCRACICSFIPRRKVTPTLQTKCLRLPVRCTFGSVKQLTVAVVTFGLLASAGGIEANPGPIANAERTYKLQKAVKELNATSNQKQQEDFLKLDQINSGVFSDRLGRPCPMTIFNFYEQNLFRRLNAPQDKIETCFAKKNVCLFRKNLKAHFQCEALSANCAKFAFQALLSKKCVMATGPEIFTHNLYKVD